MSHVKAKVSFKELVASWESVGLQFRAGRLFTIQCSATPREIPVCVAFMVEVACTSIFDEDEYGPAIQRRAREILISIGADLSTDSPDKKHHPEAASVILKYFSRHRVQAFNLTSHYLKQLKSFFEWCGYSDGVDLEDEDYDRMLVAAIINAEFWEMFLSNKHRLVSDVCARGEAWKQIYEHLRGAPKPKELTRSGHKAFVEKQDYNTNDAMLLAGLFLGLGETHKKHSTAVALIYQIALSLARQ